MLQDRHALVKTRRWLSDKKNTWWLLIFDNYDDPDQYPIEQYCPYVFHGAVIVTTRRADLVAGRPFGCSLSTAWKKVSRSWKRDLGERMLDLMYMRDGWLSDLPGCPLPWPVLGPIFTKAPSHSSATSRSTSDAGMSTRGGHFHSRSIKSALSTRLGTSLTLASPVKMQRRPSC
jgi:hypothetical protein